MAAGAVFLWFIITGALLFWGESIFTAKVNNVVYLLTERDQWNFRKCLQNLVERAVAGNIIFLNMLEDNGFLVLKKN